MKLSLMVYGCGTTLPKSETDRTPSHDGWNKLLKEHVDSIGLVDYEGFIKDSVRLEVYLTQLSNNPPSEMWTKHEQLAYWINLYNAATIKLIIQHYPIESIKDIGSSIQIPFVNTPWQIEFIEVGDQTYDLDDIEHNIIREEFDEPCIHFALVCAAMSCPKLRNEAYSAANLDVQLADQARTFLTDKTKNIIAKDQLRLSKIFWWYGGDFKKHTTKIEYLNSYSPVRIDSNAEIEYLDYDWSLNEQANHGR